MIVDGKTIAAEILEDITQEVASRSTSPKLTIVTASPNFETQKYLALKKKKAAAAGIATTVIELLEDCTTADVVQTIKTAADQSDGIVVQLPLPKQIDTNVALAAVPVSRDVDGIHFDGEGDVLPPVVGAIASIAEKHDISFSGKQVVIIGAGRLVGAPALLWVTEQGATATVLTETTPENEMQHAIAQADIIISGAGSPAIITPEHIKVGVVIFDAGTSEDGGALVGDVDPACADKASLLTPVPGGIGPVTVAYLLKNLITLTSQ